MRRPKKRNRNPLLESLENRHLLTGDTVAPISQPDLTLNELDEVNFETHQLASDAPRPSVRLGDFDEDGRLDADDANRLTQATASSARDAVFDLNRDQAVDHQDLIHWVQNLANTWFGDVNLDRLFDTTDILIVFQAGRYDTDEPAIWTEGDWNGDGRFDSSDLILALQDGGFEAGPKPSLQEADPTDHETEPIQDAPASEQGIPDNIDFDWEQLLRDYQGSWGNYQGICGTGILEMQRNYPDLYHQFLETERRIAEQLAAQAPDDPVGQPDAGDANDGGHQDGQKALSDSNRALQNRLGDDALAELLHENRRTWGNYQGLCGTALVEMQRYFPHLYDQFLETEKELENWLNQLNTPQDGGGNQGAGAPGEGSSPQDGANPQDSDRLPDTYDGLRRELGDEALAELLREQKQRWGNYQGLCGTALVEMQRNFPHLYDQFLETEKELENWLNGTASSGASEADDESGDDHSSKDETGEDQPMSPRCDPSGKSTGATDHNKGEPPQGDPDPAPDPQQTPVPPTQDENVHNSTPTDPAKGDTTEFEPEDERVRRGFEAEDVTGLRTLTIRLGGREAGVTMIDGEFVITEDKATAVDPETGTAIEYWDFNQAVEIQGEMWYAIYVLSLGDSPLNMLRRIVESAETLGQRFLDETFQSMIEEDQPVRVLEVKAEHLILLYTIVQFDQGVMPQVGDHLRTARDHVTRAGEALERGDWLTAYMEFMSAQGRFALAAIEVLPTPAGKAGKPATRAAGRLAEPTTDAIQGMTRNLDEAASELRQAARNSPGADAAARLNRTADQLDEASAVSKQIQRIDHMGRPRPANYPVAARDRGTLTEQFGDTNVEALGRRDPNNVLVVTGPDGQKQVWVRPEYGDYRNAYADVHGEIPAGFDVDHLQSRGRAAQQGYGYVRLELVDSDVNQAWGRALEKRTVNMGRRDFVEPLGPPPVRAIDQFQWWKLQGITPDDITRSLRRDG